MFKFDPTEFKRVNTYKSLELSNGAILTARSQNFGDVFRQEPMPEAAKDWVRFVTEGRIVNERLRKQA